jgi:omega-amidase
MKISVIQPELVWEKKAENFSALEGIISPLYNKTDIVILPEMFNTGFSMNTHLLGEGGDSETIKWMRVIAKKGNLVICGSYIVEENSRFHNRWVFVSSEGDYWHYDKRHLFSIGDEDKFFTSGKSRLTFTFRGIRVSPFICYDLRFPVWSRNRNDYDLAIYSANWPEARTDVWETLLKARAIENQCFVAGSNIVGTDGAGIKYKGDSLIIGPKGETIARAEANEVCSVSADLSVSELTEFRKKFPVCNDADEFMIKF